ncbi:MAG: nucleoside kinase [Clostridia bacterium]|nr:nucleoside kinase [Clostridia bacterium]
MRITWKDRTVDLPGGAVTIEGLRALGVASPQVLAAVHRGRTVDLTGALIGDGELKPLTLADEEGRRVYERSLRFVMLLAIRQLWPGQQVRIEYSVGNGVYVRLPGFELGAEKVAQLEDQMRVLTEQNLRFEMRTWSRDDAIRYFERDGQPDKVALLKTRPYDWFNMYRCGGMWEYFYGAMTPGTGNVKVFKLHPLGKEGFVLSLPSAAHPDTPSPYVDRPKHMAVFDQSGEWCKILGVTNVADLTRMRDEHELRRFIRVNESLHETAMNDIARRIVADGKRVVLVAGPSSSGKTTFAGRLALQLQVLGHRAWRVSLDDYYIDRDKITPEPDGTLDLERIDILDLPLLRENVNALLRGEIVTMPRFSFVTGKREPEGSQLHLGDGEIIILEGIHALNPMLSEGIPADQIHRIFVSALTCLNLDDHNRIRTTDVRLLRRVVRDHLFRGTKPEGTLAMWESVRRGEEKWIFPWQESADSVFNTALHYELPILRHYAYDLLQEVSGDTPGGLMAVRLMKILHYVPDVDEDILREIPPLSLLREFIGGSTIDEK